MKRLTRLAAASVLLVSAGGLTLAATASPAAASVCGAYRDFNDWEARAGASSECPPGTFGWQHRVKLQCQSGIYFGPWKGGTSKSTALCRNSQDRVVNYWLEEGPQD